MFEFANPSAFLLLLPLVWVARRIYGENVTHGIRFAPTGRIPSQGRSWRTVAANVLPALFLTGFALLIIGMARPRTVLSRIHKTSNVIAIEMVVDVSGSMEALDMSDIKNNRIVKERTRLDAVKEAFAKFIEKRPDDLIGLVTFGGYASTLAPMTTDHEALLPVLEGVQTPKPEFDENGNVINQDELLTAIGDGLATAAARIEKAKAKSKVIVLLSDGESNTGQFTPEQAIEMAKKLGIKVYTIGVGSTGRAPFMTTDRFGRKTISYAQVKLDERMLRKIADNTGGMYFNVKDKKGLEKSLEKISKLETTKIESDIYRQFRELFGYLIFGGLFLVLTALTLNIVITKRIL